MRLYSGDEFGKLKAINCERGETGEWKLSSRVIYRFGDEDSNANIQELHFVEGSSMLVDARSDGFLDAANVEEEGSFAIRKSWKETRFKNGHKFIGLTSFWSNIYWCTSNGALGSLPISSVDQQDTEASFSKASLPMNLCDWRISPEGTHFAYGGEEVNLSIWDVSRAFTTTPSTSSQSTGKRKRDALLPNETWRAKNLPNDHLNLRQPIHITSLDFIPGSSAGHHVVVGTQRGPVHRYDTRTSPRPASTWNGIAKVGGIGLVRAGLHEHDVFVSDQGCNVFALDTRSGRVIYSYKKISGAASDLIPIPGGLLASTCKDGYFRLHSTFPPPTDPKAQQGHRGEVVASHYLKSFSTVFAYDSATQDLKPSANADEATTEADDVWAGMEEVEDGADGASKRRKQKV